MGELTSSADVHDLIRGLTLLGTGGGGRPEQGLEVLLPRVEAGRTVTWVAPESVPDTLLPEGSGVGVVGAVADPKLRTPAALALLGPAHYGYDVPYTPMEQLVRS